MKTFIAIANAFLAFCSLCLSVAAMLSPIHMDVITAIMFFVIFPLWFAGAIGLFLRHYWAWWASLIGIATMVYNSLALLIFSIMMSPYTTDPTEGSGYAMILGVPGLLISLLMVLGLFKLKKTIRKAQPSSPGDAEASAPEK